MRAALPELAPDLERLAEEWGEEQPGITIVAATLISHVVNAAHADDDARLRELSAFMERMATGSDRRVRNALTGGVLEVVGDDRPALDRARKTMGSQTLALSIEIETFWAASQPSRLRCDRVRCRTPAQPIAIPSGDVRSALRGRRADRR